MQLLAIYKKNISVFWLLFSLILGYVPLSAQSYIQTDRLASVKDTNKYNIATSTQKSIDETCQPNLNCTLGDGLRLFELNTISNVTDCSPGGYGDYTDLSIPLMVGSSYELKVATGYGDQHLRIWIDFNDNLIYEMNEIILNDFIIGPGQSAGYWEGTTSIMIPPINLGNHLLRAKTNYNASVPDDACEETTYGETEEYSISIQLLNDIGVVEIVEPNDGFLTENESITIKVKNFGINPISDIPVRYQINEVGFIEETIPGDLLSGDSVQYTFSTMADMSALGTYSIFVETVLSNDELPGNNGISKVVVNGSCQPNSNCTDGDGLRLFELNTISNTSDCSPGGYGDFTDLSTSLSKELSYELKVATGFGKQHLRVWIDFNDNLIFETNEIIIDDFIIGPGQESGYWEETTSLIISVDANPGSHTLRAKTNFNAPVPDDACEETTYGETEDYSVNILPLTPYDVGIIEINSPNNGDSGNAMPLIITAVNFGLNAISAIPVRYKVNDGEFIQEIIPGILQSGDSVLFTFNTPIDMTEFGSYLINAESVLSADQVIENNSFSKVVFNYPPNDIGVIAIISPEFSDVITSEEILAIEIENFGTEDQVNFDVVFSINGLKFTETIPGPLNALSTMEYTFDSYGDFSAIGSYNIMSYTSVTNDFDHTNDTITIAFIKDLCQPESNCTLGDDIRLFQLGDINNFSFCNDVGYEDFTELSADLEIGNNYNLTLATGYSKQHFRVWIDFNDNLSFEMDEIGVDDFILGEDESGSGYWSGSTQLSIPYESNMGTHLLRIKSNYNKTVPDNSCEEVNYGETEDYTVNILPSFPYDIGVISIDSPSNGLLSESEHVVVTVFNYGINTVSDFNIRYKINGGTYVNEIIPNTIATGESIQFTFTSSEDLSDLTTYSIYAETVLPNDFKPQNDGITKNVTSFPPHDIGIVSIVNPETNGNPSGEEPLVVTIQNFGGEAQASIEVTIKIDDAEFTEIIEDTIGPLSEMDYTFNATGDFLSLGTYNLLAYTALTNDFDNTNDTTYATIIKNFCQPQSDCMDITGIREFKVVGEFINSSDCYGYSDYSSMSFELQAGNTYNLIIKTTLYYYYTNIWIDYNDNLVFENEEKVVDNYRIPPNPNGGWLIGDMDIIIPYNANPGEHLLRAKVNINPNLDECETGIEGETEDYTVVIVGDPISVEENIAFDGSITVSYLPANVFKISLISNNYSKPMTLTVHDVNGRKLIQNQVNGIAGEYTLELDMSSAPAGVYLLRIGTSKFGKVKRIVVN
jgi:hypothetical protein